MSPSHRFRAQSDDQHDLLVCKLAGQVVKQLQRGLAGPMQILDDQEERLGRSQVAEKTGHTLKEICLFMGGVCRIWYLQAG